MEKEERSRDFIGIEKRALVHVDVFPVPGETVGSGVSRVGVTPVAFAPVTGDRADAGVGDGRGEEVGPGQN